MNTSTEVLAAIRRLESALAGWDAHAQRDNNAAGNNGTPELPAHLRAEMEMMRAELDRLRREFAVQLAATLRC